MFVVTIKLHSILKIYNKGNSGREEDIKLNIKSSIEISELIELLDIDKGQIGVITIDGKMVNKEETISSDSKIEIYPIFPGG